MARNLDAALLARRQKDIEGYILDYEKRLMNMTGRYTKDLAPAWQRMTLAIEKKVKALYVQVGALQNPSKIQSLQGKIRHLEALASQIAEDLKNHEAKLQPYYTGILKNTFEDSYYMNGYFLERAARVGVVLPILTPSMVLGVMANPWLPDGATYSDRIRANTAFLAKNMRGVISNAVAYGWGWNETARKIRETSGESYFNAVRLARTELNRAAALGASYAYMQNADILDGKRWNATLDSRTAPKDANNDGKTYDLDYDTTENPGVPGQRIPNHPNCRCRWTPLLSALGVSAKERIARGQGDTPSHFGKRTFTNARTYREYAAERGLPDLDERLNNDNPKRYLRPGESVADIQKQVKTWTPNGKNPIVISKPDWEVVTGIKSNMELTGYDAAAKFKNEFNIQINNYEKIDDRVMTAVYTSMNKVVGKIPGITKYISNIDFTKLPAGIAAEAHYSFINLSVVVFKNMEHLKNTMARTVADGFFPKGIKDHSIFTHEIGHVVVNYLKLEVERITKDRKYLTGDKIISLIKKEAKKRCSIKFNYTSDEIKNLVSGYSTYNANELIAEAFSEYMDSDAPRPVAKSIGEVIEEMVHQVNNGQWNFK